MGFAETMMIGMHCVRGSLRSLVQISVPFIPGRNMSSRITDGGLA